MAIAPIRIQSPLNHHREMVAFAHRARTRQGQQPRPGVLMLNPLGQEAVRTHRLMRVLADRLARAGHDVLRFDYHGTGDSPGDDQSASLTNFAADALAAAGTLCAMSKADSFTWLGIRLGASVALMAARQSEASTAGTSGSPRPDHLVLWEPVLDGTAHLKALSADHHRALLSTYSLPGVPRTLIESHQAVWPPVELIGFEVSAQMAQEIEALHGEQLAVGTPKISLPVTAPGQCQASATSHPAKPAQEVAWRQGCQSAGSHIDHYPAGVEFDWTSEEALNTALVPAPAVSAILEAINAKAQTNMPGTTSPSSTSGQVPS